MGRGFSRAQCETPPPPLLPPWPGRDSRALTDRPPVTGPGVWRTLSSLFSPATLSLERSHLRVVILRHWLKKVWMLLLACGQHLQESGDIIFHSRQVTSGSFCRCRQAPHTEGLVFATKEMSRLSSCLLFLCHYLYFCTILFFSPFYHIEIYISTLQDWCPPSSYLSDLKSSFS